MNLLSIFSIFRATSIKVVIKYLHVMTLRSSEFRQNRHGGSHILPVDITTVLSGLLTFHFTAAVLRFVRLSAQNYPIDLL